MVEGRDESLHRREQLDRDFNITTGQDRNLDRQFNERPSFAAADAVCSVTIKCTRFGKFNLESVAWRADHSTQLWPGARDLLWSTCALVVRLLLSTK